jgi:hypothetical protein
MDSVVEARYEVANRKVGLDPNTYTSTGGLSASGTRGLQSMRGIVAVVWPGLEGEGMMVLEEGVAKEVLSLPRRRFYAACLMRPPLRCFASRRDQ